MILDSIGCTATAAATTGTATAAVAGDSLTVKNARPGSKIMLLQQWATTQTAGFIQTTAPNFNDTTRGIRHPVVAIQSRPLLGMPTVQPLVAQDLLSITAFETAVAGDIFNAVTQVWYEDMPGQSGRYVTNEELVAKGIRTVTVQGSLATGTAGGWSGGEALNADSDLLRPNRDYAVLGCTVNAICCAVGLVSPDWGNARIAIPGDPLGTQIGASWFQRLARAYNMPLIPILNSGNKASIVVSALQDENGVDIIFGLNLVELETDLSARMST